MKVFVKRLKVILPILGATKFPVRQTIPTLFGLIFLGLTYYAGFLIGESTTSSGNYFEEWGVSVTSDGFLEVSKILKDPRTTSDPMVGWFANKLQVQPDGNSGFGSASTPSAAAVLQQMSNFESSSEESKKVQLTSHYFDEKWIRAAESTCSSKKSPIVLLTVISAPNHVAERDAIRKAWGRLASRSKHSAIVYIVGTPPDGSFGNLIIESDLHGDLAISSNIDTYNNLTLKTLSAFRWMQTFCSAADYVLKTDDDMFIQTDRLVQLVKGLRVKPGNPNVIIGNVASGWEPVRNKQSKYYIDESQYSENKYPAFVTGPSYLVSRSAVDLIVPEALTHPFIHLEDVFLTGIIADMTNVPRRLALEFRNNAVPIPAKFLGCTLLRTISIHKVTPAEQMEYTKLSRNPVCGGGKV